ncbi:hypothetical protein V2G26_010746 [Clonostachys chloroleuca]
MIRLSDVLYPPYQTLDAEHYSAPRESGRDANKHRTPPRSTQATEPYHPKPPSTRQTLSTSLDGAGHNTATDKSDEGGTHTLPDKGGVHTLPGEGDGDTLPGEGDSNTVPFDSDRDTASDEYDSRTGLNKGSTYTILDNVNGNTVPFDSSRDSASDTGNSDTNIHERGNHNILNESVYSATIGPSRSQKRRTTQQDNTDLQRQKRLKSSEDQAYNALDTRATPLSSHLDNDSENWDIDYYYMDYPRCTIKDSLFFEEKLTIRIG